MKRPIWIYGYELDDGEFNELGFAWDYETAKTDVDRLNDSEIVIREKVAVSNDRCHKKWKVVKS